MLVQLKKQWEKMYPKRVGRLFLVQKSQEYFYLQNVDKIGDVYKLNSAYEISYFEKVRDDFFYDKVD